MQGTSMIFDSESFPVKAGTLAIYEVTQLFLDCAPLGMSRVPLGSIHDYLTVMVATSPANAVGTFTVPAEAATWLVEEFFRTLLEPLPVAVVLQVMDYLPHDIEAWYEPQEAFDPE